MPQERLPEQALLAKASGRRPVGQPRTRWINYIEDLGWNRLGLHSRKMMDVICVPSNFMANWRVPKFSTNNCAQSFKKTIMCPKFCTNPVLKYTKCHISTNLSNFVKLRLVYCQNLSALAPTNRRLAEKNQLSGNTGCDGRP